ncbi:TonB-dependent receptor [uncultured Bacteroides sp.]|uniref:TonB-dependent receptor n=1 Tax=uncultured Bacteroides sp. TaxID=162156 RepID=UPI002AAAF4CC|nr:TonB-dependent receptor [uncultured Bacteroides sp.]
MKQINNVLFATAFLSLSLSAAAQTAKTARKDSTLNRVVIVEKEYNPDIMDASKVNVLPKVQEPSVSKKKIEYNTSVLPFSAFNDVMQPVTLNLGQEKAKKGYARLGYGNNGNVDAKINYLFNFSKRDQLGVSASLDGMNATLKLPEIFETTYLNRDWKSRYYRSKLDVDYQHQFDKMTFDAAINMGTDNFNYHPFLVFETFDNFAAYTSTDKQHHSKWDLHAGVKSMDKNLPLQFQAETDFLFFKQSYSSGLQSNPDRLTERIWRTKGDVYGMINEEQQVGIKAEMNNVFYTSEYYKNYSSVELNPYYTFSNDLWKVRLGAHVDLSFGKGKGIQVAPDIDVQYLFSKSYVAYLKIGGGRNLNDFRRLESLNPYSNFHFKQLNNSYNQLDAVCGLKANVGTGFWFDVFSGYSVFTDDLCFLSLESNIYALPAVINSDTKHFYVGSNLKYNYKGIVDFSLKETYYAWSKSGEAPILMKPKFDFQFNADIKLLPELTLNAGYRYIKRNKVELISPYGISGLIKLDPISDLSLGATYDLFNGVSIFARINNILNQTYQYNYSYPAQGINFLGGVSFRF